MALLLTFNTGGDDAWLHEAIRGESISETRTILLDQTTADLAMLKHKRQQTYGGCSYRGIHSLKQLYEDTGVTLQRIPK